MMSIQKKKKPLYEVMRQNLLKLIETEHIDCLPNENELISRYHVSRNTLRHAVSELTKEGILQPMQGIGTLVHPISGLKTDSKILLIFDVNMLAYQQEIFHLLLFRLGKSKLRVDVLMIDHENVDRPLLKHRLRDCDAVIIDMLCSFSPVIRDEVGECGKKRLCLRWDATQFGLPSLETDISGGMYLLMKHLLEYGHRKFILLGDVNEFARGDGMFRALKEFGLDRSCMQVITPDWNAGTEREIGMNLAREMMNIRTDETAVIANNDCIALCVEDVALAAGLRIPEDLSVIGFDNLADSAFFPVPLTTCSGKIEKFVSEAVAYLFSSRKPNDPYYKKITPELVIRKSTAPVKQ